MATRAKKSKDDVTDVAVLEAPTAKPASQEAATPPNGELMLKQASGYLLVAQDFVIDSPIMYEAGAEQLKAIKGKIKQLNDQRLGITRKMDEAKKAVMALFKPAIDKLEMAESCLKEAMGHWDEEQRKAAAAAQKLLDDHARQEKERIEAIAREQEEKAKAEANRAAELAAAGDTEAAEQAKSSAAAAAMVARSLGATATVMVAPTAQTETPKVEGIRYTSTWKATVVDKRALLAHILAEADKNPALLDMVDINMAPLHDMARSLKDAMQVPGVTAAEETGLAAGSR